MEQLVHQSHRFISDPDDGVDFRPSGLLPDNLDLSPHHPAFDSFDLRPSSPHYPATPSYNGSYHNSPYSAVSELDFDSKDDSLALFDNDPLAISPRDDPSEYDAPTSSAGLLMFDDDFMSGVNNSNRVSVSITPADDPHSPAYYDHGSPSSSNGGAESGAENDRRSPASSVSSHHPGVSASPHLDFNQLRVESPYHGPVPMPNESASPQMKPQSPPVLVIPDLNQPSGYAQGQPVIHAPEGDGVGPRLHIVPATPVSGGETSQATGFRNTISQGSATPSIVPPSSWGHHSQPASEFRSSADPFDGSGLFNFPGSAQQPRTTSANISTSVQEEYLLPPSPSRTRSKSDTSARPPQWNFSQLFNQQAPQSRHLDHSSSNFTSGRIVHMNEVLPPLDVIPRPSSSASAIRTLLSLGSLPHPYSFNSSSQGGSSHFLTPDFSQLRRARSDGSGGPRLTHRQSRSEDLRPTMLGSYPGSAISSFPPSRHVDASGAILYIAPGDTYRRATTIDMLPDDVLLEIFDFYRKNHDDTHHLVWKWHFLVHVCRRWRQIVFMSPHRLNLQILCTHKTPVEKNLGIWPAFPIAIDYGHAWSSDTLICGDNVIAALLHRDRIYYLGLNVATGSQLGKIATAMQETFPVLTCLQISSMDGNASVLPTEFLGGSAPRLQKIFLYCVPFPTLPTLLLSANDLVELSLHKIPPAGYISPEAIVACLATLLRLKIFVIEFQSATPRPARMRPPPTTRIVLPALVSFQFRGASEYLEDLVSRIDSPQVNGIFVNYFNQFVDFQVARLSEFINRSLGPEVTLFRHAQVSFFSDKVFFTMYRQANHPGGDLRTARTLILCQGIDWQVSHIAQVLSQFSTTLSTVAHLKLKVEPKGRQLEGMDDAEWLNLLYQFSTVKTLHVSQELAEHVALALKDIAGESVTEVLPSLDLICLAGQPASSVEEFVAARRQYDRPVIVIDTERIFNEKVRSYLGRVYIPMQPYTQTNIPSFGNVSSIPVAGVPVWPAPSMTGDLDLTFNWESQAITLPQDPHVNEVTRTLIGSGNTVLVPEITLPWILPVRRRASSPTPGIGVPPKISRSTTRTCPNPACTSAGYIRRQELTRHVITHLPYSIYCPHPNCNWRGRRYDTFGNHYINGHPHDQVPDRHSFHEYTIYDARLLAEFLINKKVTLEEAIDDADAEVREMAVKLGKWDMWNLQPPSVRELVLGQLSHHICCSHPCCVWRGSRHYALMKHWQEEHPHDQGPDCGPLDAPLSTIYNARQLVERLIDREVTLKQAIDEADVAVRKKAVELGKWDMWNLAHLGQTGHSGVVARNLGLP